MSSKRGLSPMNKVAESDPVVVVGPNLADCVGVVDLNGRVATGDRRDGGLIAGEATDLNHWLASSPSFLRPSFLFRLTD